MGKVNTANLHHIAGWVAMIAVPIAPAFYFGFDTGLDAYKAALPYVGAWATVAGLLVGTVGALGLELVGILAGHTAVRFFTRGHYNGAFLASAILIGYVTLGITGLEHLLQKGVVMFLIAPLAYLLVGMQATLEETMQLETERGKDASEIERERLRHQQEKDLEELRFKQEQERLDREVERQLKLQKQKDETAVKLAKTEATSVRASVQPGGQSVDTNKTDWRTFTDTERLRLLDFTREEIVNQFGVADKTAGRWLERADKLSRKMSEKVSQNGHVK